ncbi:30S ribosomal protein S15 [Candidatus Woesearchaeota archaeon]|nr:30S ribosomal protein S15 [Candidatus Woesearchaeota archaeon]
MARMHSRKRGKSGSSKPASPSVPTWLPLKQKEIEMLILKLSKEGVPPSRIGLTLRDQYGVPDVKLVTGKTITKILEAKNIKADIPEDLMALIRKAVLIRKHLEENHKDQPGKRGLKLTESKILRLSKYYKGTERLPKTWKYDPETIKLQVD